MTTPFRHLAVAVTCCRPGMPFCRKPGGSDLLQAELTLIHVSKRLDDESQLRDTVQQGGLDISTLEIIRQRRDPANAIVRKAKEKGIDLLIVGALEKESILRYYLGSVAEP